MALAVEYRSLGRNFLASHQGAWDWSRSHEVSLVFAPKALSISCSNSTRAQSIRGKP